MKRRTFLTTTGAAAGALLFRAAGLNSAMAQGPNLPARGEFTVRNAIVLTMDATLGDFRDGDIHVRNGQIVAIGSQLPGGGTSIDGTGFIAMPGLIDTHQHIWTSIFRGLGGEKAEIPYFAARAKLGPSFTPEHMYRAVRLAMVQAINSGVTTSNNMHHDVRGPEYSDATIKAQSADTTMLVDLIQRGDLSQIQPAKAGWILDSHTPTSALRSPQAVIQVSARQRAKVARSGDLPSLKIGTE
jgi:5-methylthioadenosine/S-adenosylhomocysteine deaminase